MPAFLPEMADEPMQLSHPVIACVGPTASGKTALSQELAKQLGGEVVSADSMQIYRHMDIGTGKILPHEQAVPHFGLDIVNPGEPYSAALFQDYARRCFVDIDGRGKRPVLCGGTGFYVRAAIDDYQFPKGEQVGNPIRERYRSIADEQGPQALWELLEHDDPESASLIAPNDVKRVIRAFELLGDGTSYARQKQNLASIRQHVPAIFIGLSVDPGILRKRIDDRVDEMVARGLEDEVRGLLDKGFRDGITAPQAIGYKEVVAAIDGDISMDEAIEQIKTATHRYAKRQRTWFKKDRRINWLDADELNLDDMMDRALEYIATIEAHSKGASHA